MTSTSDRSVTSHPTRTPLHPIPDSYPQHAVEHRRAPSDTLRKVLLRGLAVIAVAMVIGAGLGALFHAVRPETWSATIGMRITGNVSSLVDPTQPSAPSRRDVLSEVDLMKSDTVRQRALEVMGEDLPDLQVTSGIDSDVAVLQTKGSSAEEAAAAVAAYAEAYEGTVSDQQRRLLSDEAARLRTLNEEYNAQFQQLNAQIGSAPPEVLASASAMLIPITEGLADSSRRLSRIDELLGGLPANAERLGLEPIARDITSPWQLDVAAGAVIVGAGAGLVLYRCHRHQLI